MDNPNQLSEAETHSIHPPLLFGQRMRTVVIVSILFGLLFIGILTLSFPRYSQRQTVPQPSTSPITNLNRESTDSAANEKKVERIATEVKSCKFGIISEDQYLNTYTVQPKDTLLSIAKRELGSTSRINEIVFLNYKYYPSIYTNYHDIQPGWKLYLPPPFLSRTSGGLIGYAGKIVKGIYGPQIALNSNDYSESYRTTFNVWEETLYFGEFMKRQPQEGDCITMIMDTLPGSIAIAVAPQDKEGYFTDPNVQFAHKKYIYDYSFKFISPCDYHNLEQFGFSKYVVRSGDSLNSIAKEQLGDEGRAVEIREINKWTYQSLYQEKWAPELYGSKDFLEAGWEFILPPIDPSLEAQRQASRCWYGIKN